MIDNMEDAKAIKKLPVIEIFGPVIQGEGSLAGRQTIFIRFGGCDYRCSWCDTLYAVTPELVKANSTYMTTDEIIYKVNKLNPKRKRADVSLITLSGGNPAMHDLYPLLERLREYGFETALETQGTITPKWLDLVDYITVSPKGPSSGMNFDYDKLVTFLEDCKGKQPCIKIVVANMDDFRFALDIDDLAEQILEVPRRCSPRYYFYLQTCSPVSLDDKDDICSTILERTRWLIETNVKKGRGHFRVMPQLHTMLYGQVRGV